MGQAMREWETRQQTGEIPALSDQQCDEIMKARPVVLGGRSPNGKAMAVLSCRCGATCSVELVIGSQDQGFEGDCDTIRFEAPARWIVRLRVDYLGEQSATIVRCPEHNFTKTGLHI